MKKNSGITLLELTVALAVLMAVLGFVLISAGGNNNQYRALHNAALQLQADMRYAQRLALMEGRRVGVSFEPELNRYSIITLCGGYAKHRTIYFQHGVRLRGTNYPMDRVMYLPRGTAIPGTIILTNGPYWQEITTTLSGGQVRIHNIVREG